MRLYVCFCKADKKNEYVSHQGVSDRVFVYRRDGVPAEVLYEGYPGPVV